MRKVVLAFSAVATAAVLSTSAMAQPQNYPEPYGPHAAAIGAGVVTGTVLGVGASQGWFGTTPASLTTAAGASAFGLVAGIGTTVLIDSLTTPCHGFGIWFDYAKPGPSECANGQWVGPRAEAQLERRDVRVERRVHRRHRQY
jgi:hypothetical protein